MRLIIKIRSILLAIVIGFASLWALFDLFETSTALVQSSSDIEAEIALPEVNERDIPTDIGHHFLIQANVPLTEHMPAPDGTIFVDSNGCPCEIDSDNDGLIDALWEASGQGRTEPDSGPFEGQAVLSTSDATTVFTFENVDQVIRDENDTPVGIVLSGRGLKSNSRGNKEFRFSAVVERVPGAPERLNLQILGPGVSIQFQADGRLTYSQSNPDAFDAQF